MLIPDGYAQVNHLCVGPGLPTGAQWTYGLDVRTAGMSAIEVGEMIVSTWNDASPWSSFSTAWASHQALVKFGPNDTGESGLAGVMNGGTASGPSCSPNVALLVRKQTGAGGRSGRGRMYLPCWTEGQVGDAGVIDETARGNVQIQLNAWFQQFAVNGIPWVVLHGAGAPLTTPTPITALSVDSTAATQRRRLRR